MSKSIYYMIICMYIPFFLLSTISFHCLYILKVLRFEKFHDVNMLLFCKRGRSIWYPIAPTRLFLKKSYWRYRLLTQQFVIRNLISWICNRYFMGLGYNNFYANIGLALYKLQSNKGIAY